MKDVLAVLRARASELARSKGSRFATEEEIAKLAKYLQGPAFTSLLTIYRELPICDVDFAFTNDEHGNASPPGPDFPSEYECDGEWEHAFGWMSPEGIMFEFEETYAGTPVFAAGFLPIGDCSFGSGDPYCIRHTQATELDVPLYQIYYDWVDPDAEVPVPPEAIRLVSRSLARVLEVAAIY